jgi:hypothetical protein
MRSPKPDTSGLALLEQRHLETVALIISRLEPAFWTPDKLAEHFADQLAFINPRFKRALFLRACLDAGKASR